MVWLLLYCQCSIGQGCVLVSTCMMCACSNVGQLSLGTWHLHHQRLTVQLFMIYVYRIRVISAGSLPLHLQGHSIGGALAVLLMLMFRRRGVLAPQQIAPVYTFGAPAIFCDGALGACAACGIGPDGAEACSVVRGAASHGLTGQYYLHWQ